MPMIFWTGLTLIATAIYAFCFVCSTVLTWSAMARLWRDRVYPFIVVACGLGIGLLCVLTGLWVWIIQAIAKEMLL